MRYCLLILLAVQSFAEPTLVAIGRVPANQIDATGQDTLGGFFSAMAVDAKSWSCSNEVCTGTLFGLADRGFGDGAQDYRPRLQVFRCAIDLTTRRVVLTNTAVIFLTQTNGVSFSGLSTSSNRLDPEGLVRLPDGDFYVAEEYGPDILRFGADGRVKEKLPEPAIYRQRRDNRGFEGLTMTPGGKLVTILQSPLVSDGGNANNSVNTRILVFDKGQPEAEYVYQLNLFKKHTPVSEILALDEHRFLVIERDNGGLGGSSAPVYKRINLVDVADATNILAHERIPADAKPVRKSDFVDLLKAGIPPEEFPEKWEGLALVPVSAHESLLLVGTDNDFKSPTVIHNGAPVGTNTTVVDTLLLVYRLRQ